MLCLVFIVHIILLLKLTCVSEDLKFMETHQATTTYEVARMVIEGKLLLLLCMLHLNYQTILKNVVSILQIHY